MGTDPETGRRAPKWVVRGALLLWVPLMVLVGASLMVEHWVPLPQPTPARLALAGATGPGTGGAEGWELRHFLYADCRCSRAILDHLLARPRPAGVEERVVLAGDDPALAARVRAAGLALEVLDEAELESRYGVEAAPLLVVADGRGEARYVGGYTDRKQGLGVRDLAILADLRRGSDVASLPVYGCGVSDALQTLLDPLGLKY